MWDVILWVLVDVFNISDDPSAKVFRVNAYCSLFYRKACISLSVCIANYAEHKSLHLHYCWNTKRCTFNEPTFCNNIWSPQNVLDEYSSLQGYNAVLRGSNRYFGGDPSMPVHSSKVTTPVFLVAAWKLKQQFFSDISLPVCQYARRRIPEDSNPLLSLFV